MRSCSFAEAPGVAASSSSVSRTVLTMTRQQSAVAARRARRCGRARSQRSGSISANICVSHARYLVGVGAAVGIGVRVRARARVVVMVGLRLRYG